MNACLVKYVWNAAKPGSNPNTLTRLKKGIIQWSMFQVVLKISFNRGADIEAWTTV